MVWLEGDVVFEVEAPPPPPPGGKPGGSFPWAYHQFALLSSNVWDGCISISSYGIPKAWGRDSTYRPRLVNHYVYGSWDPKPAGGFTPLLTTQTCPPWQP